MSAETNPSLEPIRDELLAPRQGRLRGLRSAWSVLAPAGLVDDADEIGATGRALTGHLSTIAESHSDVSPAALAGIDNLLAFYARVLFLEGRTERAREVAELALAQNEGNRPLGPGGRGTSVLWSLIVLGRTEDAIVELETLFEAGWRYFYQEEIHENPFYATIRDDPRVAAIRSATDAFIERERPLCLQLLADNGYL